MALLPFLTSLPSKVRQGAKKFFEPTPEVRTRDVLRDIPSVMLRAQQENLQRMGMTIRPIARGVIEQSNVPYLISRPVNLPGIGTVQPRRLAAPGSSESLKDQIGLVTGTASFGIGKVPDITKRVIAKYGKPLGDTILKQGQEFAQKALVIGGEDAVSHALKIDPVRVTIGKLIGSIKEAQPVRAATKKLFREERAARTARGSAVLEREGGERAFFGAKSQLKGELPRPDFEPFRERFGQAEVDTLFDFIKTHPMPFFDKINAMSGLSNVLGKGKIPTSSELKILTEVFGKEFGQAVLSKRPFAEKFAEGLSNVANLPRSLMSSIDMSAPFRQGLVLSIHKPARATQAFVKMFKFFFSEKHLQGSFDGIRSRPMYKLMQETNLAITDTSQSAIGLVDKEEAFMSNLAAKIPVVGTLVRASERAYVGFLNQLRADVFDDMARTYIESGINPDEQVEVFASLAKFINAATGRGDLGKYNKAAPILNGVFFSPRLQAARLQMLNPVWYAQMPAPVRKEAAKAFVKFIGTGISLVTLASLAGADVETNPRSSDFAKIRFGNFRWDVWGGYQQWVRFTAQLILGETKSATTGQVRKLSKKDFPFTSRLDHAFRFLQQKLAPTPSLVAELLRGESLIGEEIGGRTIEERFLPLYIQDVVEAVKEGGYIGGIAVGVPAFFGVGAQVFGKRQKGELPKIPELPALPKIQ